MSAIFSSAVSSFLKESKTEFLKELDSRIQSGQARPHKRIIEQVKAMLARTGGQELFDGNPALQSGYSSAKRELAALRVDVIKKETARIQAAWPLKITSAPALSADAAEAKLLAEMERAILYIMYPKGYFLTSVPMVTAPKDNERRALAQRVYSFVVESTKDALLQGVDNGRIFLADVMSALGKKTDIKDIRRACADAHSAVIDEIANCQNRSGHCWLDIRYSDSIKKGMGITWEVHNYE